MKKVKALRRYKDLELNVIKEKGEEFEVEDQRAAYLVQRRMVEIIEEAATPKKTSTKKTTAKKTSTK